MGQSNSSVVMLTTDRQIDRRVLLQADSLEAVGWKVRIIAMPLDSQIDNDDPRVTRIGYDPIHARQESRILNCYRWLRRYLLMNSPLMRWMKRQVWCYLVDPESFYTRLFCKTVSHYSADVFVAHDLPMLPLAALMADTCGARLVYDSHELYSEQELSNREKQRWTAIESKYIGGCDLVMTVNQSIATELEKRYSLKDVKIIYNAERVLNAPSNTRYFHEMFELPMNTKVLLFQGGLSAGRHLEVLVDAMQYLHNETLVLVVLGDGLLLNKLQRKARTKMLAQRVFFRPAVPQKDLLGLTAAADAGIIPYQASCLNNRLCTPNKLFEFIAAGLPVIASDLPEIRKIVEGQQMGLVGDTGSPKKLAWLIDDFFCDEARFERWRANLPIVAKRFCWEVEEKKLSTLYEAL